MNKEIEEIRFAVWVNKRINLERAIQEGKSDETMTISGFMALLEHSHMLDIMLVRSPKRMAMYGAEEETLGSLRFLEALLQEIRCEKCQKDKLVPATDFFWKDQYE